MVMLQGCLVCCQESSVHSGPGNHSCPRVSSLDLKNISSVLLLSLKFGIDFFRENKELVTQIELASVILLSGKI